MQNVRVQGGVIRYLLLCRRFRQKIAIAQIIDFNILHPISVLLVYISQRSTLILLDDNTDRRGRWSRNPSLWRRRHRMRRRRRRRRTICDGEGTIRWGTPWKRGLPVILRDGGRDGQTIAQIGGYPGCCCGCTSKSGYVQEKGWLVGGREVPAAAAGSMGGLLSREDPGLRSSRGADWGLALLRFSPVLLPCLLSRSRCDDEDEPCRSS